MMFPRSGLSICIVFHNEGEKVLFSLRGLFAALSKYTTSYDEAIEIVFVDNCSQLNCRELIVDFCKGRRIPFKMIKNDTNNMARARNKGVSEASYDKIIFLDADCVPEQDWLVRFRELVSLVPATGFAAIGGENTPPAEFLPLYKSCEALKKNPFVYLGSTQLLPVAKIKNVKHIPTCNALYLRQVIQDIGGFNEEFVRAGEDLDLNARLIKRGFKIYYAPGIKVEHRDKPRLADWFKKSFRYGSVQPRILLSQGSGLDISRWIPVGVLVGLTGGLLFVPKKIAIYAFIVWWMISFFIIAKEREWRLLPYFPFFLGGTIFAYLAGYLAGFGKIPWIYLRSKNEARLGATD